MVLAVRVLTGDGLLLRLLCRRLLRLCDDAFHAVRHGCRAVCAVWWARRGGRCRAREVRQVLVGSGDGGDEATVDVVLEASSLELRLLDVGER